MLAYHYAGTVVGDGVHADVGVLRNHTFIIVNDVVECDLSCIALLSAGDLVDPAFVDRCGRSEVGHDAVGADRRIGVGQDHFPDLVLIELHAFFQALEVPVQALRELAVGKLSHGVSDQCQVAALCVSDEYAKVDRPAGRHIGRVGPLLVHAQSPALEVADFHMRIRARCDGIHDSHVLRRGGIRAVVDVSLEGISVGDIV